jgi:hypothetical protein
MKNEQRPKTRMTEGLQADVLRLSTSGRTADVGKSSLTLQQNPSAAQVGQLPLQRVDLAFTHRQL